MFDEDSQDNAQYAASSGQHLQSAAILRNFCLDPVQTAASKRKFSFRQPSDEKDSLRVRKVVENGTISKETHPTRFKSSEYAIVKVVCQSIVLFLHILSI